MLLKGRVFSNTLETEYYSTIKIKLIYLSNDYFISSKATAERPPRGFTSARPACAIGSLCLRRQSAASLQMCRCWSQVWIRVSHATTELSPWRALAVMRTGRGSSCANMELSITNDEHIHITLHTVDISRRADSHVGRHVLRMDRP